MYVVQAQSTGNAVFFKWDDFENHVCTSHDTNIVPDNLLSFGDLCFKPDATKRVLEDGESIFQ